MALRFAKRMSKAKKSFVREIFKFLGDPEMISFSGGFPNPASFPVEGIKAAAIKVLECSEKKGRKSCAPTLAPARSGVL